jgi:hypothetical protein
MSVRGIGLVFVVLLALPGCGAPPAKSPDVAPGAASEAERWLPLKHDTVFSYLTTDEVGQTGIYVMEITRPRAGLAELKVASKVFRRYFANDGIRATADGGYVLRSPLSADAKWQGEFGQVSVKALSRTIKVPAGSFGDCIETLESVTTPDYTKSATSVFCAGVGMVYYKVEGEQDGVTLSQKLELKSFGPRFVPPGAP